MWNRKGFREGDRGRIGMLRSEVTNDEGEVLGGRKRFREMEIVVELFSFLTTTKQ